MKKKYFVGWSSFFLWVFNSAEYCQVFLAPGEGCANNVIICEAQLIKFIYLAGCVAGGPIENMFIVCSAHTNCQASRHFKVIQNYVYGEVNLPMSAGVIWSYSYKCFFGVGLKSYWLLGTFLKILMSLLRFKSLIKKSLFILIVYRPQNPSKFCFSSAKHWALKFKNEL